MPHYEFFFQINPPSKFHETEPVFSEINFDTDEEVPENEGENLREAYAKDLGVKNVDQISLITKEQYLENTEED